MNAYHADRPAPSHPRDQTSRSGFTLVELLIVITIIGIIAAIALGAVQKAQQTAREAKTRGTIAKLNEIILDQYESYRNRRVESKLRIGKLDRRYTQARRLNLIRDLVRMEMPQRWDDVLMDPVSFPCLMCNASGCQYCNNGKYETANPALQHVYRRYYRNAENQGHSAATLNTYASAECLYLVVLATNPHAMKMFTDTDIGDVDGDGLKEFVDGWGNPIYFLRWAPAFNDTDVQTPVVSLDLTDGIQWSSPPKMNDIWYDADAYGVATLKQEAMKTDHDPFDPFFVSAVRTAQVEGSPQNVFVSWRLVPLIYSAGPDGIYDIHAFPRKDSNDSSQLGETDYFKTGCPYTEPLGLPWDTASNHSVTAPLTTPNQSLDHYDNIHNHRLQVR